MFGKSGSWVLASALGLVWSVPAWAMDVKSAVLRVDYQELLPISRYDLTPEDLGFAGAALADEDNGTTGRFLGHSYDTITRAVPPEEAESAAGELVESGAPYVVVIANGADTARIADAVSASGGSR